MREICRRLVDWVRAFVEDWRALSRGLNAELDKYRARHPKE